MNNENTPPGDYCTVLGAVIMVKVDPTNVQTSAHLTALLYVEHRKYINEFSGCSVFSASRAI